MAGGKTVAKNFADGYKNDRTDNWPGRGREPADHRDEHHLHRQRNGKYRIRIDVAEIKRIEAAGETDDKGREDQSDDAGAHSVDTSRLGAVDIFAHRRQIGSKPRARNSVSQTNCEQGESGSKVVKRDFAFPIDRMIRDRN